MIVRAVPGGLELIEQDDHGQLAGAFARALADVSSPRSPFETAAAQHDNGWREHDARPVLNPATGQPHTYRDIPAGPYRPITVRGIERALGRDPYAGLLVSLHFMRFFGDKPEPEDRALLSAERARQQDLLDTMGLNGTPDDLPSSVAAHHEALYFCDVLSLIACEGWGLPVEARLGGESHAIRAEGDALTVEPWPFSGPIEASVPVRRLDAPRFDDQAALDAAIRRAGPPTPRRVVVVPPR